MLRSVDIARDKKKCLIAIDGADVLSEGFTYVVPLGAQRELCRW